MVKILTKITKALLIKRGEEKKLLLFFSFFLIIIMGTEIGAGVSMSFFLNNVGPEKLPFIFLFTAILNFGVVIAYMYLSSRKSNKAIFSYLLFGAAVIILPARLLLPYYPVIISYLLYAVYEFIFSAINLHFSVYLADYFDTMESKRLFPIIFSGSRLGGIIGGLLLTFLAPGIGSQNIIFIWLATLGAGILMLPYIEKKYPSQVFDYEKHSKESTMFFRHIKSGLEFMKGSNLLKALAGGLFLLGMLSLIIKFLYSDIFFQTFQGDKLTAFFGIYIVASNILALILQLLVANKLIDSLGLGAANSTYAVCFSSGFLALIINYGFLSALWARFSDEQLESVLQDPVEGLFYNAVPDHERARAKALSSGMIKPLSEITGSLILQGIKGFLKPHAIAIFGFIISILYIIIAHLQNKGYVDGLMKMVRDNTLNLDDLENLRWEKASKKDLDTLYSMVSGKDEKVRGNAVTLLLHLDEDIDFGRISKGFFTWQTDTQEEFLAGYFNRAKNVDMNLLHRALAECSPNIKQLIIEYFIEITHKDAAGEIKKLMNQTEDLVLQNSAIRYFFITELDGIEEAGEKMRQRLSIDEPDIILANLAMIRQLYDDKYLDYIRKSITDSRRKIVIAAANTLAEVYQPLGREDAEILTLVDDLIRNGAYHETRAAVKILGKRAGEKEKETLIRLLGPSSRVLNQLIIEILVKNYPEDFDGYLKILDSPSEPLTTRENIILLLQKLKNIPDEYKDRLKIALRSLVENYFEIILEQDCLVKLNLQDSLMAELQERNKCQLRLMILGLLGILLHQKVVISIEKALITKNPRLISNALELFENMWDKKQTKHLVNLIYPCNFEEDLEMSISFTGGEPISIEQLIKKYLKVDSPHWHICASLMLYSKVGDLSFIPDMSIFTNHNNSLVEEIAGMIESSEAYLKTSGKVAKKGRESKMLTTIEKVIYLKNAPLFKSLKMDELRVIADISRERNCTPGEVIIEKDDVGHTMYIIADGEVEIYLPGDPPKRLTTMKEPDFFGEMALFSTDVRSASVKALTPVKLLCLDRDHFLNLIYEKPDISIEIIKVLSDRIRRQDN
ncbi:MAG: cyclic nucleotide-binding domain-containing protein [Candidatus Eremiobacteraeota bacterium]|nr:cyclic nucleotide-binding domain-containing protein [Candidatus Eremiobacteraeota bacterium]